MHASYADYISQVRRQKRVMQEMLSGTNTIPYDDGDVPEVENAFLVVCPYCSHLVPGIVRTADTNILYTAPRGTANKPQVLYTPLMPNCDVCKCHICGQKQADEMAMYGKMLIQTKLTKACNVDERGNRSPVTFCSNCKSKASTVPPDDVEVNRGKRWTPFAPYTVSNLVKNVYACQPNKIIRFPKSKWGKRQCEVPSAIMKRAKKYKMMADLDREIDVIELE